MSRAYKLQKTPENHVTKLRPTYSEIREDLAQLETVALTDLKKLEEAAFGRRTTPVPPDPAPAPKTEPPLPPAPVTPIDMQPLLQPTEDQGQQGSCFAFAGTHAQNLCEGLAKNPPSPSTPTYSPACLSWNTRVMMGTSDQDSGGNLGDAILAQEQTGTCGEALMPYNQDVFNVPPDAAAVADEATHKATFKAYPLDMSSPANLDQALADGYPVYLGFWVWQGFENTGPDGICPPPDGTNLGGHAQLFFYTENFKPLDTWADQNSWGEMWGLNGRCWFPRTGFSTIMDAYVLVPVSG